MNLLLRPGILDQVIAHAKTAYPAEGCGLLIGRQHVERFKPVTNISESKAEYEMDPAELIAVLRDTRDTGEHVLAIYHSHPNGPAEPSKKDIARAYYPEAAHLIISLERLERPQAAAFRLIDGQALPIEVHVIV